jgi:guanylate kinase
MRLDVQGAGTIRNLFPEALLIFLTTRTEQELLRRLEARKSETPDARKLRIDMARKEMTQIGIFDYVVVNAEGELDEAVETILAIIEAEHHRVYPRRVQL